MPTRKHDQHTVVPDAAAAATALRDLADQVSRGALETCEGPVPLEELERLRVALSPQEDGVAVDVQLRRRRSHAPPAGAPDGAPFAAHSAAPLGTGGDPAAFKAVKKRLAKARKALREPLRRGELPELGARRAFLELTAEMVRLERWADPAFAAFLSEAEGLMTLDAPGDLEALLERLRELEHTCHARYRQKGKR